MTPLCFIDTETTGLDPRIHQPYEVCYWREQNPQPITFRLSHTLDLADPAALKIGNYFGRGFKPMEHPASRDALLSALWGVTLVGSNPAFDAAMMTRVLGVAVWHHRMIDVAQAGMWVFGWDRPKGLADVRLALLARGHDIPEPDHTAEGDVRTTRAVYEALRKETA